MTDTEAIASLNGLKTEAQSKIASVRAAYTNFDASKASLVQAENAVTSRLRLMEKRVRYVISRYGED